MLSGRETSRAAVNTKRPGCPLPDAALGSLQICEIVNRGFHRANQGTVTWVKASHRLMNELMPVTIHEYRIADGRSLQIERKNSTRIVIVKLKAPWRRSSTYWLRIPLGTFTVLIIIFFIGHSWFFRLDFEEAKFVL